LFPRTFLPLSGAASDAPMLPLRPRSLYAPYCTTRSTLALSFGGASISTGLPCLRVIWASTRFSAHCFCNFGEHQDLFGAAEGGSAMAPPSFSQNHRCGGVKPSRFELG